MRGIVGALLAAGSWWLVRGAQAQQPAPPSADVPPDLEFLEYLGSWQADDAEWLAIREWDKENPPASEDEADEKGDGDKPPAGSRGDDDESK